jgi:hypothetical protein
MRIPVTPLLAALLGLAPAYPLLVPDPAAPAAQEHKLEEFKTKFAQAMAINAADELAKLVKQYPTEAMLRVEMLCENISRGNNSDQNEYELKALRTAWTATNQSNFVGRLYEYHSQLSLDAKLAFERTRVKKLFDERLAAYSAELSGTRASAAFEEHARVFRDQARAFMEIGDFLYAGKCWIVVGSCYSEGLRGKKDANSYLSCEGYKQAVECYDKVEFRGSIYSEAKAAYEQLKAGGFDAPPPDPNAPKPGEPVVAAGAAPLAVTLSFQPLSDWLERDRPIFQGDDTYQLWPSVQLRAKDSTATFNSMKGGPTFKRTGAAQFTLDDQGDGTPEDTVGITGNFTLVNCKLGVGTPEEREWAFVCKIGQQDDLYQGLKTNLGPGDAWMDLYVHPAASMGGVLDGVPVRVLDDNADGVYGSAPLLWAFLGLGPGSTQPDLDSIIVGEEKRARPWSEYLQVGGKWYQMASQLGGKSLTATPVELDTGTLKLECKGEWPAWLVLQGTGKLANAYFDVAEGGKKGVALPVGEYKLFLGILEKGKKQQMMRCLILPAEGMAGWTVEAGKETLVKLGAPLAFEFEHAQAGNLLTVKGPSVRVRGSAGERYERTWNCPVQPEVSWRKAGAKKGSKPEKMSLVTNLEELDENGKRKYDFAATWRPLDLVLDVKKAEEKIEVQLVEKKHKLLGDIESPWR